MIKLKDSEAPAREHRLGTGIAYGGTCGGVREYARGGCMNAANRSFTQTHGCQFTLSLTMLNSIRDSVIVMHGPIGCGASCAGFVGMSKTFKAMRDPNAEGLIWLNTNLDENDVISGGDKKLRDAVIYADREFRPETIIVPVSCVPSLIGDDIETAVNELQSEVSAVIIPIYCPGFKTKVMATAYDAVYHGILRGLVNKPERFSDNLTVPDELYEFQRKYRDSHTVNILNVGSMSRQDELELERLLNAIGLSARFLPNYSGTDDFKLALESALNVSVCGTHDDYFLQYLQQLYNIPFLIDVMPVGRKNTSRWLMNIAKYFELEKEARNLIASEEKDLDKAFDGFRPLLKDKTAFIAGGEIRVIATAEIVQDLGMKVIGIKGHHYDRFAEALYENVKNLENVPFNVATQQPFEQVNLVRRLKPDIYIGHSGTGNVSAKQGIPLLPLFGPANNYMGYSGAYDVARRIKRVLSNGQFNRKLARHCPMPYRDSWFETDPYAYIN
jgi:nitrogenase molybdenum-iron protein alpha chain